MPSVANGAAAVAAAATATATAPPMWVRILSDSEARACRESSPGGRFDGAETSRAEGGPPPALRGGMSRRQVQKLGDSILSPPPCCRSPEGPGNSREEIASRAEPDFQTPTGRGETGWCSGMTSTHGAWRRAGLSPGGGRTPGSRQASHAPSQPTAPQHLQFGRHRPTLTFRAMAQRRMTTDDNEGGRLIVDAMVMHDV